MAHLVAFQRNTGNTVWVNPNHVRYVGKEGRDVELRFDGASVLYVRESIDEVATKLQDNMSG